MLTLLVALRAQHPPAAVCPYAAGFRFAVAAVARGDGAVRAWLPARTTYAGAVGGAAVARASQVGLRRVARRVGELVRAAGGVLLFLVAAVAWLVRPLAAQLPDAEAAF